MKVCPNCGAQARDDQKFCESCGHSFLNDTVAHESLFPEQNGPGQSIFETQSEPQQSIPETEPVQAADAAQPQQSIPEAEPAQPSYGVPPQQNPFMAQPEPQPPVYAPTYGPGAPMMMPQDNSRDVGFGDWMLTLLLTCIPIVGFIMLIIWAVGDGDTPISKRNWARAQLIWLVIFTVIGFVFAGALFTLIWALI